MAKKFQLKFAHYLIEPPPDDILCDYEVIQISKNAQLLMEKFNIIVEDFFCKDVVKFKGTSYSPPSFLSF